MTYSPSFLQRAGLVALTCLAVVGRAQETDAAKDPKNKEFIEKNPQFVLPKWDFTPRRDNLFSTSLRYNGSAKVTFSNLGIIDSGLDFSDLTSETTRVYHDGTVGVDTRTDNAGASLADDGKTNNWSYNTADQITGEGTSIAFHEYSAIPNSSTVQADAKGSTSFDLEYNRILGRSGKTLPNHQRTIEWGLLGGWGMSEVNAKNRGVTSADLVIITDTYDLLGAPPPVTYDSDGLDDEGNPVEGYTAPSSQIVTVTDSDGTSTSYVIDTTTYLANRPDDRTKDVLTDAAEIQGLWQLKGAYFTFRAGPWVRWTPTEHLAIKVSAGATATLMGMHLRYAERLRVNDEDISTEITAISDTQTYGYAGYFGSFELEWWLTRNSGLFLSAYYEGFDASLMMTLDGRSADASITGGLGLRLGFTTRF